MERLDGKRREFKDIIHSCRICGETISLSTIGVSEHIRKNHNIKPKDYYDNYVEKHDEKYNVCKICDKPTKFINFLVGYRDCCSRECSLEWKKVIPVGYKSLSIRQEDAGVYTKEPKRAKTDKKISIIDFECKLCGIKMSVSYNRANAHLNKVHGITAKRYYDEHMKRENEGVCEKCGKDTSFLNSNVGYLKFCSLSCSTSFRMNDVEEKKRQTKKFKDYWSKKENRERQSEKLCEHLSKNIRNNNSYKTGMYFSKKMNKEIFYQSSYECVFYWHLDRMDNVVSFDRCEDYIKYEVDGIVKNYLPDIKVRYIDGIKDKVVEIKPKNLNSDELNKMKWNAANDYYSLRKDCDFEVWNEDYFGYNSSHDLNKFYEGIV